MKLGTNIHHKHVYKHYVNMYFKQQFKIFKLH